MAFSPRLIIFSCSLGLALVGICTSSDAADAPVLDKLLYFDEPVGFSKLYGITVYRGWSDRNVFYLLPTSVGDAPSDSLSVQYESSRGTLNGVALFSVAPAFNSKELEEVMKDLRDTYPMARFVLAQPVYSEFEVVGFEVREIATPVLSSNPLLSPTGVSVKLNDLVLRALLQEGTQTAAIFGIRHRFAIKGVELGDDFQPRIVTRWFNRGASILGSCSIRPERYINVKNGARGCIYRVVGARSDVSAAQELLNQIGKYKLNVDGVDGLRTRGAIREFQEAQGIAPDGLVTGDLLARLRVAVKARGG